MRLCLNVQSLQGSITGIERYTYELLRALDLRLKQHANVQMEAVFAQGCNPTLPKLAHVKPVEVPGWRGGKDYMALRRYLKQRDAWYANLSGGLAVQKRSIVVFHDLRPYTHPEYDSNASRLRFFASLKAAKALGCRVVTVSDFSRDELLQAGFDAQRITLAPCGWEHISRVASDSSIFDAFPQLVPQEYYYVLGSLAPHKNLAWVLNVARTNPNCTIALAGKLWDGAGAPQELPSNVHYLGYVSDGQSKALLRSCKAFLHPSLYEGFGLPPLEALACGKRVLAAGGTAVEGVCGDALRYFCANNYEVDLDALASFEPDQEACGSVLRQYTWKRSAQAWLRLLESLS